MASSVTFKIFPIHTTIGTLAVGSFIMLFLLLHLEQLSAKDGIISPFFFFLLFLSSQLLGL
jgi:hypothetical protein